MVEKSAAGVKGAARLRHYWTKDPRGTSQWVESPEPWTTLEKLLERFVGERAKGLATVYFHDVFGFYPGSDLNRVTHGHPPRGHKIGPG